MIHLILCRAFGFGIFCFGVKRSKRKPPSTNVEAPRSKLGAKWSNFRAKRCKRRANRSELGMKSSEVGAKRLELGVKRSKRKANCCKRGAKRSKVGVMKWRGVLRKYPLPLWKYPDGEKSSTPFRVGGMIPFSYFPRVSPAAIEKFDPVWGLELKT